MKKTWNTTDQSKALGNGSGSDKSGSGSGASKLKGWKCARRNGMKSPRFLPHSWHRSILFVVLVLTSLNSDAINPGCRCVRFVSTFGKEFGSFGSPDFPAAYPSGIPCFLYLFTSPPEFIVQLNFSHIHLPTSPNGCHSGDYLKLFLHLEGEGVNESTPWNFLMCGERSNETYFSASRHVVIQFHAGSASSRNLLSAQSSSGPLGFHGFFRFLNASQFESNGRVVPGTKCDYRFESRNYSSPEGKFFSPYYPSHYPHNIMCSYKFFARAQERVKIVFESVNLEPGVYSCLNKTDVIRVFDGSSSRVPVIALICNAVTDYEILSSGQDLLVEFIGNSDTSGNGFRAKFHFIKAVIYDDPYDPSRFNLEQIAKLYFPKLDIPKPVGEDGKDGHPQASTLVPKCDQVIYSDSGRNGSLSSPLYPSPYQPKSHCILNLIGSGRQRVQISFVDFHLFHTDEKLYVPSPTNNFSYGDNDKKCAFSDTVSAFVYINGVRIRILEHCGLNPPPDIMSNDHRLTLEFNAKASTVNGEFRGFYAHYGFVEDFGVKSGLQAKEYPCAFIFNISSHPNGTIQSPNFPGLYPRASICHLFFHGNDEKGSVDLSFDHFNVAGTSPCQKDEDDYLEYSNYMPTDIRFARRCGYLPNLRISGGGPNKFFRVTFRSSNDGWADGKTGFHASFTFTRQINHATSPTSSIAGGNVISDKRTWISLLLFYLGTKLAQCLHA